MSLSFRMTNKFAGHARGERPVANDRHDMAMLVGVRRRDRHTERCADRGAGMPNPKGVVLALATRWKRCKAARLLDGMQLIAPSGQYLMRIGLMADIPNEAVVRRVEHIMQRDGELDRPETGGKMAATGTDAVDEELSQLVGQGLELAERQPAQVRRNIDGIEQRILLGIDHQPQSTLRRA